MAARKRTPNRRKASRRRRRAGDGLVWKLLVPILLIGAVIVAAVFLLRPTPAPQAAPPTPACPVVPDVVVATISVPAGPIEGYCQPALENAAEIIRASDRWTTDDRAKYIGVMVAIGESNLQNLNYGDTAGPDSRGLFQQRSNWGTLAERMDPYTAAFNFYQRMLGIVGWQSMTPTAVAHRVQGNANPNYYTPYYPKAQAIVEALLGDRLPPPLTASPTPIPTPPGKP